MQIAPPAKEVILEDDHRAEDSTFANQLAAVLLNHINAPFTNCTFRFFLFLNPSSLLTQRTCPPAAAGDCDRDCSLPRCCSQICLCMLSWLLICSISSHCHEFAGTKLPVEVSQALHSGSCSMTLESWLKGLQPPPADTADFDIHVKLLLACNSCLDEAKVVGREQALQSLGASCCDAMQSTAFGCAKPASSSTQVPSSSGKPVAQLTADLTAELAATSCRLPAVLKALQSGLHGAAVSFLKAQKLVEFLAQMKIEKSNRHGIIFVKTRAGAHALTELLQHTADLEGVSVSPLTGHGKNGNVAAVTDAMKGMNLRRQVDTLDSFRAAQEMNVLVATAAAEEGIDIPRCEFAISYYTVVESGREWTQRQGRARMHGSQSVSIIQRGTTDLLQLNKSKQEADNAYAAVMHSCFIV